MTHKPLGKPGQKALVDLVFHGQKPRAEQRNQLMRRQYIIMATEEVVEATELGRRVAHDYVLAMDSKLPI